MTSTSALLRAALAASLAAGIGASPRSALAWGHTGHLLISELAVQALPAEIPSFVRLPGSARLISELGAEADVSKGAGLIHDAERNPGHYIDIDDSGKVEGVSPFSPLAATREAFDTAQRTGGETQYSSGYLPYNIIDGWQQVRKDFALYRAVLIGFNTATDARDASYFGYQLGLRKALILRDIGYWSHFIADGSQPLHVSVHYDGWGNFPNPNNYTQAHVHAPFEGAFVRDFVSPAAVSGAIPAYRDCKCLIEQRVPQYLLATLGNVGRLYQLAGPSDLFTKPERNAVAFATGRLAAGAAELRDEIVDAWRSSTTISVGYPPIKVTDIISGKVHLTRTSLASD